MSQMQISNMQLCANIGVVSEAVSWANHSNRPLFIVVLGTRPCYVKLAPLIGVLRDCDVPFLLVESGQHHENDLTGAKHEFGYGQFTGATLNIRGSLNQYGAQIFERVTQLSELLGAQKLKYPPIPIVSGDTATAGIFSQAWYLQTGVRSIHIEAGLRSYGPFERDPLTDRCQLVLQRSVEWTLMPDDPFPESLCSRQASQASRILFAPTERNRAALLREGFEADQIFVVGSLSADAVSLPAVNFTGDIPLDCRSGQWIRVDLHRRENMTVGRIEAVLGGLELLNRHGLRTVLIVSNALRGSLDRFGLWGAVERLIKAGGLVQEPWSSYLSVIEFLKSKNCVAIYTDSGGLQEEACILGVKCFTCRFGTDRPETVLDFRSNLLVPPASPELVAFGIIDGLSGATADSAPQSQGLAKVYGMNVAKQIASVLRSASPQEVLDGAYADLTQFGN